MRVIDLALVGGARAGPKRLDQLDGLGEPGDPSCGRDLEQVVLLSSPEADTQGRPARTQVIQRRDLMSDMDRVIGRQHEHRYTEPDVRGHRGGVGEHGQRVEAAGLVHGVVRHPQVLETQLVRPLRHVLDHRGRDRIGGPMWQ